MSWMIYFFTGRLLLSKSFLLWSQFPLPAGPCAVQRTPTGRSQYVLTQDWTNSVSGGPQRVQKCKKGCLKLPVQLVVYYLMYVDDCVCDFAQVQLVYSSCLMYVPGWGSYMKQYTMMLRVSSWSQEQMRTNGWFSQTLNSHVWFYTPVVS